MGGAAATGGPFSLSVNWDMVEKWKGPPESPGDSADSEGLAPQNWCLFLQLRGFHAPVTKMRKLKYAECSHGILTVLSHLESLLTGHLMIQTSVKMTLLVVSLVWGSLCTPDNLLCLPPPPFLQIQVFLTWQAKAFPAHMPGFVCSRSPSLCPPMALELFAVTHTQYMLLPVQPPQCWAFCLEPTPCSLCLGNSPHPCDSAQGPWASASSQCCFDMLSHQFPLRMRISQGQVPDHDQHQAMTITRKRDIQLIHSESRCLVFLLSGSFWGCLWAIIVKYFSPGVWGCDFKFPLGHLLSMWPWLLS